MEFNSIPIDNYSTLTLGSKMQSPVKIRQQYFTFYGLAYWQHCALALTSEYM